MSWSGNVIKDFLFTSVLLFAVNSENGRAMPQKEEPPSSDTPSMVLRVLEAPACKYDETAELDVLSWGRRDFQLSFSNSDTSRNAWNRHLGSFMVDTGNVITAEFWHAVYGAQSAQGTGI